MTRREAISLFGRVAATSAGQAAFASWVSAVHQHSSQNSADAARWANYAPQFFSPEQFHAFHEFTEVLIPSDETPGAREAYVAQFVDYLLNAATEYAPEMQSDWHAAINWLVAQPFAGQSPEAQHEWMERVSQPSHPGFPYFQEMKSLAVYAFYTSRAGLIDDLEYKGLAYLTSFPACSHPEHQVLPWNNSTPSS